MCPGRIYVLYSHSKPQLRHISENSSHLKTSTWNWDTSDLHEACISQGGQPVTNRKGWCLLAIGAYERRVSGSWGLMTCNVRWPSLWQQYPFVLELVTRTPNLNPSVCNEKASPMVYSYRFLSNTWSWTNIRCSLRVLVCGTDGTPRPGICHDHQSLKISQTANIFLSEPLG